MDAILPSGSVVRVSPLKLGGINGDFDGPAERKHGVGAWSGQVNRLGDAFPLVVGSCVHYGCWNSGKNGPIGIELSRKNEQVEGAEGRRVLGGGQRTVAQGRRQAMKARTIMPTHWGHCQIGAKT